MSCVFGCCECIRDFYSGVIRGELFYKTCPVKINIYITIVNFPHQIFVFNRRITTKYNLINIKLCKTVSYIFLYFNFSISTQRKCHT